MTPDQTNKSGACARLEADLVLFHYAELSDPAREQVAAHIKDCAGCSRYLIDLAQLLPKTMLTDEPPPEFWHNYSRELRDKIADIGARRAWWPRWLSTGHPWAIPALATSALVILVLSFTVGEVSWRSGDARPQDDALLEVLPITEHLDFYNSLEFLDSMELLESIGEPGNGA